MTVRKPLEAPAYLQHLRLAECHYRGIVTLLSEDLASTAELVLDSYLLEVFNVCFVLLGRAPCKDLASARASGTEVCSALGKRHIEEVLIALEGFCGYTRKVLVFEDPAFARFNRDMRESVRVEVGHTEKRMSLRYWIRRWRRSRYFKGSIGAFVLVLFSLGVFNAQREFWRSGNGRRYLDLEKIRISLDKYHIAHGAFPASNGWNGFNSCWGEVRPDWIVGLGPRYIDNLPRDPSHSLECSQQYIYWSNGKDYKLLSMYPPAFYQIEWLFPEQIDPRRGAYAFGYWTTGARDE